ncbi:diguanylate cyclase domain-containing protein [Paenibacillus silvisoli]|uniref:diguanylate cyclase domain-containing protein n=1 Tax=Paenibacillus silvisoli TaxID=3110539 RepID=UPI002804F707|nr:diguanylate cyclase [Paenibacillus silvisoli]
MPHTRSNPSNLNSDEVLRSSQKQYVSELQERLRVLTEITGLSAEEVGRETVARIYRMIHSIKGSAPILGFNRIGELAMLWIQEWQWTQQEEAASFTLPELRNDYMKSAAATEPYMHQMELELEQCFAELGTGGSGEADAAVPSGSTSESSILIIEDDHVLRHYLANRLSLDGYHVDEASNVDEAIAKLRVNVYHLITLDLMMYPQSGYRLFELIKDDLTIRWIPMIVLSGCNDISDKIRCFNMGADDYVVKPFQYDELSARVRRLIHRHKEYKHLAFHDPLTGLYNRRYMDQQLQIELDRAMRYPAPLTLVVLDIDHFKTVNDSFGHQAGDRVLQGLSKLLTSKLRRTDFVARWGGEEFVLLLPGASDTEAAAIMQTISQHVRENPIAVMENTGSKLFITFSAGVVQWKKNTSVSDWMRHADFALYKAKRTGRNRVVKSTLRKPRTVRILVAEDDRVLRRIIVESVSQYAEQVTEAKDGAEALRLLQQESFDICILDCLMPQLGGLEVLAQAKQAKKSAKFLVVTGNESEANTKKAASLGADEYLVKPFDIEELKQKVKSLINSSWR